MPGPDKNQVHLEDVPHFCVMPAEEAQPQDMIMQEFVTNSKSQIGRQELYSLLRDNDFQEKKTKLTSKGRYF